MGTGGKRTAVRRIAIVGASISLDWDYRSGVSEYRVVYGSDQHETTASSYTASSLTPDTSYTFSVSAYGDGSTYSAEWGDASSLSDATCPPPPPVENVSVEPARQYGTTTISVSWSRLAAADDYRIQRRMGDDGKWSTTLPYSPTDGDGASGQANVTSGIFFASCDNETFFRVAAYGNGIRYAPAWGAWSESTSMTSITPSALDCPNPPGKVPMPTVESSAHGTLDVNWSAPSSIGSSAIIRYGVQYKTGSSSSWTDAGSVSGTTSTTIPNLTPGTSYLVQAQACNSAGCGPWSDSITGEPVALQVSIEASPANPTPGQTVTFTATISNAPRGSAGPSYEWQIGSPWHTFGMDSTFLYHSDRSDSLTFRVRVAYGSSASATSELLTVTWASQTPLALPNPQDWTFMESQAITAFTLPEATGGTPPYTYAVSGLPTGLSFDSATREVSGTPTAAGEHMVTYAVTDSASPPATESQTFTITIRRASPPPDFGTSAIRNLSLVKDHLIDPVTLPEAESGVRPLMYSLSPSLPGGLSFDATTREISGTPDAAAMPATYTYTVRDPHDPSPDADSITFRLEVINPTIKIDGPASPGYVGEQLMGIVDYSNPPRLSNHKVELRLYPDSNETKVGFNNATCSKTTLPDSASPYTSSSWFGFIIHVCGAPADGGSATLTATMFGGDDPLFTVVKFLEVRPITADNPFPITTGTTAERDVTLTANVDGPTGASFTYQ